MSPSRACRSSMMLTALSTPSTSSSQSGLSMSPPWDSGGDVPAALVGRRPADLLQALTISDVHPAPIGTGPELVVLSGHGVPLGLVLGEDLEGLRPLLVGHQRSLTSMASAAEADL